MRNLRNSTLGVLVLAAIAVALAPMPVHADNGVRVDATFIVSFMYPAAADYCGNGRDLSSAAPVAAQGIGRIPGLGPMFLTVAKCFTFADLTYAGTFSLSDGNGATMTGTYAGTQSANDANGFGPFQGTLTVTGGTGGFRHARGRLEFGAVASPTSPGATGPTAHGTAYYLVRGALSNDRH